MVWEAFLSSASLLFWKIHMCSKGNQQKARNPFGEHLFDQCLISVKGKVSEKKHVQELENVNRPVNRKAQRKTGKTNRRQSLTRIIVKFSLSSFSLSFFVYERNLSLVVSVYDCVHFLIIYEACKKLRYTNDCLSVNLSTEYQHESLP